MPERSSSPAPSECSTSNSIPNEFEVEDWPEELKDDTARAGAEAAAADRLRAQDELMAKMQSERRMQDNEKIMIIHAAEEEVNECRSRIEGARQQDNTACQSALLDAWVDARKTRDELVRKCFEYVSRTYAPLSLICRPLTDA